MKTRVERVQDWLVGARITPHCGSTVQSLLALLRLCSGLESWLTAVSQHVFESTTAITSCCLAPHRLCCVPYMYVTTTPPNAPQGVSSGAAGSPAGDGETPRASVFSLEPGKGCSWTPGRACVWAPYTCARPPAAPPARLAPKQLQPQPTAG